MDRLNKYGKTVFIELATATLIFLFVYTASSKFLHLPAFKSFFTKQYLFKPHAATLAIAIPLIEMAVAALLFFPASRQAGIFSAAVLMTIFTLYIAVMLAFASALPCSCGGVIQTLSWKWHLALNVSITVVSWLAFAWCAPPKNFIAINRSSRKPV
ncbi:MAG TPA: MauE/DoxX family redox-associated membrane protein [Flavisolibacter sp.]|jgi:hypothetical protein|nr:MauE/DoxX family redox-associated membrane protein [Flavisolibacter sp.]